MARVCGETGVGLPAAPQLSAIRKYYCSRGSKEKITVRAIQSQLSAVEYRNGQMRYRAIFVFDHEYYRLRYRLRTDICSER